MFKSAKRTSLCIVTLLAMSNGTLAQGPIATGAPVLFAPGVISGPANDGAPTFSPDGNTLYFARANNSWGFILESHKVAGKWLAANRGDPFSGQWSDQQPAFSPDGRHLVFMCPCVLLPLRLRPEWSSAAAAAIWQVDQSRLVGWSEPRRLPDTVNLSALACSSLRLPPTAVFTFMAQTANAKTWRLYRSQFSKGAYLQGRAAFRLVTATAADVDPQIAPDESFLIFSSAGRATSDDSHEHLYITFQNRHGLGRDQATPL